MFVVVVIDDKRREIRTEYKTEDAAWEARAFLARHGVACFVARA